MLSVRGPRVLAILLALAVCPVVAGDAPRLPWAPAAWRTAWSMPDQERASFSLNNPRHGVAEGGLAVATPQGAVAVHDPRTGRRRYAIPADAAPTAGVWVAAGTIVVARQAPGEADHRLSGYELTDGALLWRTTVTVEPVELVEGVPRYIGPRIMVTERGVTFLDRPRGPYTFTSLDLRTGRITARTVRPRDCLLHSAASARSVALVSDCAGRIELASVDPHTLRPDWTRSLPPSGQAASLSLTAGADGYLDTVGGNVESFFAPDGRLLSTARTALARPAATGAAEPGRWSRPFRIGSYPELRGEGDLLSSDRRATLTFLISLDTVTGRIRALPIVLPPTWSSLVGTTEDMAFVHDEAGWIVAYTLVHGPSGDPAPPGGLPLSDWPDACALLGDRALGALGGGYRPGPVRRTVAGVPTPKPAGCDWIPATDGEAVVSVSVAWVFSTPAAAREAFAAIVRRVKQTGRYDPTTETPHALSQTLPRLPSGMLSESIVTAGPALVHLRSSSRRAIRLLTPRLQRSLLARYEPGAVVPDAGPLAARPPGWSFPADNSIDDLVVAGGLVHAGSGDGKVYALDAVSGALRWSHQIGDLVTSGPIRTDGTVYASTFSRIVALDAVSGRTRWSRRTTEASSFVIDGRTVYAWTGAQVIALDAASGRTRWRGRESGFIHRVIPHAAGDLVYATGPGGVVALDADSGERRWRFRADGRADVAGVATTADAVYVASGDGRLHALDRVTGRPRWRSQIGSPIFAGPLASGGAVYVGGGGVLHKLDAATGARRWTFEAGRGAHTTTNALMVARGVAYLTRVGDRLHALDAATGKTRWIVPLGGGAGFRAPGPFTPVLAGDALYVAAGDGGLHALDAATGTRRWGFQTGGDIRTAPVVEGGQVYVGSVNGNVYAIRASDGRVNG